MNETRQGSPHIDSITSKLHLHLSNHSQSSLETTLETEYLNVLGGNLQAAIAAARHEIKNSTKTELRSTLNSLSANTNVFKLPKANRVRIFAWWSFFIQTKELEACI